jgi:RNA polymerase sigma-70 factor (ECF subfamily)
MLIIFLFFISFNAQPRQTLVISNDNDLFARIQRNDKQAFDLLFRKYYTPLCRFALKLNGSEAQAEEVVQEVFIYLWEQRQHLTVTKSILSYLFQSIKHKVYEHFRKNQTRSKYEEEYANSVVEGDDLVEKHLDDYEISCLVWNAVDQLPDKCREIFQLSRDEGLTYNEIAEHLNISPKTVENQMGIAFKKLREILVPLIKPGSKSSKIIELMFLCLVLSLFMANPHGFKNSEGLTKESKKYLQTF